MKKTRITNYDTIPIVDIVSVILEEILDPSPNEKKVYNKAIDAIAFKVGVLAGQRSAKIAMAQLDEVLQKLDTLTKEQKDLFQPELKRLENIKESLSVHVEEQQHDIVQNEEKKRDKQIGL